MTSEKLQLKKTVLVLLYKVRENKNGKLLSEVSIDSRPLASKMTPGVCEESSQEITNFHC